MWDIFSIILNIILGLSAIYLYLENRKLKGFEIDRDIELKEIEIVELSRRSNEILDGWYVYQNSFNKIEAELNYLKRLKKYRWIFSK